MRGRIDDMGNHVGAEFLAESSRLGVWLMGRAWSEIEFRLGVLKHDIQYVALPNETHKAAPMTWPKATSSADDVACWSAVNVGNLVETYATCAFLEGDTPEGSHPWKHTMGGNVGRPDDEETPGWPIGSFESETE